MRKGADLLSKWVGEAEKQLRLLFEEASKHQPAIIFFDEIDGLAPVRFIEGWWRVIGHSTGCVLSNPQMRMPADCVNIVIAGVIMIIKFTCGLAFANLPESAGYQCHWSSISCRRSYPEVAITPKVLAACLAVPDLQDLLQHSLSPCTRHPLLVIPLCCRCGPASRIKFTTASCRPCWRSWMDWTAGAVWC